MINVRGIGELEFWRNPCPALSRMHREDVILLVQAAGQAAPQDFAVLSITTLTQLLLLAGLDAGETRTVARPAGEPAVPG